MRGYSKPSLAACLIVAGLPAYAMQQSDLDRTVAAIEVAGCVVDASNVNDVLDGLNISEESFRAIGEKLVKDGLADVSQFGVFRLTTEACEEGSGEDDPGQDDEKA